MSKSETSPLAVLLTADGTVYGAAAGHPFIFLSMAQDAVDSVEVCHEMQPVEIRPHPFEEIGPHERHELEGRTSIRSQHDREHAEGRVPVAWGSVGGTLYDGARAGLQAVLLDREDGRVFGAKDGRGAFGAASTAQEVLDANADTSAHLVVAQVRRLDELLDDE
jgi:hypothetical protein